MKLCEHPDFDQVIIRISRVELYKRDNQPLGSCARHYYDIFQLLREEEALAMLRSEEYAQIISALALSWSG